MRKTVNLLCLVFVMIGVPGDYLAAIETRTNSVKAFPFHATVRTFEVQLPPGDINIGGMTRNPCGHIEIVGNSGDTNRVRWVAESRGEAFDLNPVTAFSGSLVPSNLQWDSTEAYLYYEFGGGAAASAVWRVHATNSVPVYVGPSREPFKLMPKADGPDWVACNQVRNGKWLWFAYTPEDIALPQHAYSTNAVTVVSTTLSDSDLAAQASRLSGFYSHVYQSWIYIDGDTPESLPKEQPMQGWEWLRIRHDGGDRLAFQLYVLGDNGHQGGMQGVARMTSPNRAEFTAPDGLPGRPRGKLVFEFDGDSVTVTEQEDCSYYRGARVTFDDTLERTYEILHGDDKDNSDITILHAGKQAYRYGAHQLKPHHGMMPQVDLAYDHLADRAGTPQPKPFDDILGNGLPALVIDEYVLHGNRGPHEHMLTIISLDGANVAETPAVPCTGEILYFKDFDGDGCMEIVNTDWEQGFRKFNQDGVPMHKGVWKYDPKAGRYRETGTEDPDPPDTWPAYRNDQPAATPPSAP